MREDGWDFQVERVDLDGLSIDAGERLGIVIVQPEYELIPDGSVPFKISEACRNAQNALIERAFQIRAAESQQRNVPIPFVLFPEAAIPVDDPDGLNCLRQQMEHVEGDVIFIGGLEGMTPQEAKEVAERCTPGADSAGPSFAAGAFVNVCVILVKLADGRLGWYFQAKLHPSQWEQQRNMARGKRVLYFVASKIAFLCQICFDHIAAQGEQHLNTALCRQLVEKTRPHAATLDFVFVPQHNPQPYHESVRKNTQLLLNYQDRALKNDMTVVVVVNKAASIQESSEYGRSGFHYRSHRWQIPISDVGPKGYELYDLDGVTSAVFRKRTEAVHVATLVPPSENSGNSGNPRRPLDNPRSYLIREGCDPPPCPCLPGTTCEVGTFVECDCLPCKLRDALLASFPSKDGKKRWQGSDEGQSRLLERHYEETRTSLLMLPGARARQLVYLLLRMHKDDKRNNPDLWSSVHSEAVVELVSALSVLAELQPVSFETVKQWTALLGESFALAVLDGADRTLRWEDMVEQYIKEFETEYYHPDARRKPVLLAMLRSRGLVQPLVRPFESDFTKPSDPNRLRDEDSYAKPVPRRLYVCQDGLFEGARQAKTISEFLETEMRCVLE